MVVYPMIIPFQVAPRPAYQKSPRQEDPAYLRWIRTQPCSVPGCRAHFVEAAHTGTRGLSTKANDRDAIPLCQFHHTGSNGCYHKGRRAFETFYRLEIAAPIEELNTWYEAERLAG